MTFFTPCILLIHCKGDVPMALVNFNRAIKFVSYIPRGAINQVSKWKCQFTISWSLRIHSILKNRDWATFDCIQVILYQKHSFLHQLTQIMTPDCWLNYKFSTRQLQVQYMLCISNCLCFDIQNNLMHSSSSSRKVHVF